MIRKPKFWKWAKLTVDWNNHEEVLQSSLVNIVSEMRFSGPNDDILEKVLAGVVDGRSRLKTIELSSPTSLDPELLSQALVRLEKFTTVAQSGPLSAVQLVSLFTAMGQTTNLKLKVLHLPRREVDVPPEVLAAALVRLEEYQLPLNPEQNRSLFTKIVETPVVNLKAFNPNNQTCIGTSISIIFPLSCSQMLWSSWRLWTAITSMRVRSARRKFYRY